VIVALLFNVSFVMLNLFQHLVCLPQLAESVYKTKKATFLVVAFLFMTFFDHPRFLLNFAGMSKMLALAVELIFA
jgi:hypothetical protein